MSPLFLPNIHELTLKLGGLKGLRILQKLFMDLEFVQQTETDIKNKYVVCFTDIDKTFCTQQKVRLCNKLSCY